MRARIGGVVFVVGALVACGGSSDGGDVGPVGDSGADTNGSAGDDGASGSIDGSVGPLESPDAADGGAELGPDASDSGTDATLASDAAPPRVCVPGESIGCAGVGGCLSNQVCNDQGTAYGACQCANEGGAALACVPGQSIACGGPGGCSGYQVCDGAGSAYGACQCPDAGGGGGVDASVGWTPAQLPGLALWLDDTYGIVDDPIHPGYVIHWLDKSGNGNNVTFNAGSEYRDPEIQNGLDALRPYGPGIMAESPAFEFGSGDFGIVILRWGFGNGVDGFGNSIPGTIWSQSNLGILSSGSQLELTLGAQTISETPTSARHFQILAVRGQQPASISNDGQTLTSTLPASNISGAPELLYNCGTGEMAEILVTKGTLTDANLALITSYLTEKFALQ